MIQPLSPHQPQRLDAGKSLLLPLPLPLRLFSSRLRCSRFRPTSLAVYALAAVLSLGTGLPAVAGGQPAKAPTAQNTKGSNKGKQAGKGVKRTAGVLAAGTAAGSVAAVSPARLRDGQAEKRLLAIYQQVADGQMDRALEQTRALVRDHPNFQLAHLLLGDLLSAQYRPVLRMGDIPGGDRYATQDRVDTLAGLRHEARQRIQARLNAPPKGHLPSGFVRIDRQHRYAMAMDATHSRLYLFENTDTGMRLIADYYASVGKLGWDKHTEGDQRTPLGIYSITSRLTPGQLPEFYGSGALPINYPNPLDQRQGRTGSGIWLHGTPPNQFARPPLASDGCIVLADQDFERLMAITQPHAIPVVVTERIEWLAPSALQAQRQELDALIEGWRDAKARGDFKALRNYYTEDFLSAQRQPLDEWMLSQVEQLTQAGGKSLLIKSRTVLQWGDGKTDSLVVNFSELAEGARTGVKRRQHWVRENGQWRIFHEGVSR